jgi:hypothetical protein
MLLFIAFACFAVLMLAWLAMPESGTSEAAKTAEPSRMPEGEVSAARA